MRKTCVRPAAALGCVCVIMVLMCTFFVGEAYAAGTMSGTTEKKEQAIKVDLPKGAACVTVSDPDSWVFAQIQPEGDGRIGTALEGENMLVDLGMKKTFVVPVKTAGTYYLYLHGTNPGASYSVTPITAGGKLKSGQTKLGTSYANNESVVWHKIKVKKPGRLKVTVKDASYRYPGYSKVKLRKDDKVLTEEDRLVKGLGYTTYYGVSKGTYRVGVRSSSELYNITVTLKEMKKAKYGKAKGDSVEVKRKKKAYGVIVPGNKTERWYKVPVPAKKKKGKKHSITISVSNNNAVPTGGINVKVYYKKKVDGKEQTIKETYLLNNSKKTLKISPFKKKNRNVYIGIASAEGATGTYSIYWK